MLTPASAATSVRRSPGTRRVVPAGRPARSGVILARRETRNSRTSVRLSTASTVRLGARRWGALPVHLSAGTPHRIVRPGQFVIGSFFASDNTCEICRAGYQSSCIHREGMGALGAQAQYLRVPLADGTLVATPDVPSDDLIPGLLAASDVLGTGWFGADAANVQPGNTVAIVGDGAVGLCAVIAAKHMGAERIVMMSRHEARQKLAREFGATDIVTERGDEGVDRIEDMTNGIGADSVLECVGTQESMMQAIRSARKGGHVAYVGVPHGVRLDGTELFYA